MIGTTLSHYRITENLGAGGMGEVYRAEDANLSRQVAIKVLPEMFSGDPERMARFEREAKLLASLTHPNIAAIHGLEEAGGKRFLVLELVEGETLAQRIAKGPLPVDETLDVCRQIAEGLEAAHEKGIIHRDLKPANVKITPEGKVKLLDFGLAKALSEEPSSVDLSRSPTLTDQMTRPGVVLGTAAYMSPEQAKGKAVDKRADIWAFGCVLYECLTGRRAFEGETITETMAAILMRDPAWELLPEKVPSLIRHLLRRCLQKDARRRLRDIGDAAVEMEASRQEPVALPPSPSPLRSAQWLVAGIALAVFAGTALGIWLVLRSQSPAHEGKAAATRFEIPLEGNQRTNVRIEIPTLAISDDGRRIAWIGGKSLRTQIFTRAIDELEIKPIPGTENDSLATLCFSPDGEWICFPRRNVLYKIPVSGGVPTEIYRAENSSALLYGLDWTDNGIILASSDSGLQRISLDGSASKPLTKSDPDRGELTHNGPRMLPGGRGLLFYVFGSFEKFHVEALNLDTGVRSTVIDNVQLVQCLPTGQLIFARAGSLYYAPFDLREMKPTGKAESLQIPVQMDSLNRVGFWDVSENGTLVYIPYDPAASGTHLAWVDRAGNKDALDLPFGTYTSPVSEQGGKKLAYTYSAPRSTGQEVYIFDLTQHVRNQFTPSGVSSDNAAWSPSTRQLAFTSNFKGQYNLYVQDLDREAEPTRLRESKSTEQAHSYSPDGKYLLYTERSLTDTFDLRILDMSRPKTDSIPFATRPERESYGRFSPTSGRWVAYTADEGGRFEIFVKEFIPESPESGRKKKISASGGVEPVWSPKGDTIYYRSEDGTKLYSVSFRAQPTLEIGQEQPVLNDLSLPQFEIAWGATTYDISADGKRFIMVLEDENTNVARKLIVVQNWFEELKRLVATGKK